MCGPSTPLPRSGGELSEEEGDDRDGAVGALPLVADSFVIDEAGSVGRDAKTLGRSGAQRRGLRPVAVCRVALEPFPERRDRASLRPEREDVRFAAADWLISPATGEPPGDRQLI